jgi:hypothetical protein
VCFAVGCGGGGGGGACARRGRGCVAVLRAVCCALLRAGRREEGGWGSRSPRGAARNLSHYLFLWISRAPAPVILRARPPVSSELQPLHESCLFYFILFYFVSRPGTAAACPRLLSMGFYGVKMDGCPFFSIWQVVAGWLESVPLVS